MSLTRSLLNPNSLFGGFDDVLATPFFSDIPVTPFLANIERDPDMVLRRSSPCYEVTENDNAFQISIDIPGVKGKDVSLEVEEHGHGHGGKVLHVSGGRSVKTTNADGSFSSSQSKFSKKFGLDSTVDTEDIKANLADGVLTIVAPKKKEDETIKKIAISESPSR
jgi:HSP20 family molecular chaperone IbpA